MNEQHEPTPYMDARAKVDTEGLYLAELVIANLEAEA